VTDFAEPFQQVVTDLIDTMNAHKIAIGLAAPQIGSNLKVAVVNISENKQDVPFVFANPRDITFSGKKDKKQESCMSVPHFGGEVERRHKIRFVCEDREGKTVTLEGSGFLARAFCHEIDHLSGLLYVDRMNASAKLEKVDIFDKSDAAAGSN
jgi:peptide deformylase